MATSLALFPNFVVESKLNQRQVKVSSELVINRIIKGKQRHKSRLFDQTCLYCTEGDNKDGNNESKNELRGVLPTRIGSSDSSARFYSFTHYVQEVIEASEEYMLFASSSEKLFQPRK